MYFISVTVQSCIHIHNFVNSLKCHPLGNQTRGLRKRCQLEYYIQELPHNESSLPRFVLFNNSSSSLSIGAVIPSKNMKGSYYMHQSSVDNKTKKITKVGEKGFLPYSLNSTDTLITRKQSYLLKKIVCQKSSALPLSYYMSL